MSIVYETLGALASIVGLAAAVFAVRSYVLKKKAAASDASAAKGAASAGTEIELSNPVPAAVKAADSSAGSAEVRAAQLPATPGALPGSLPGSSAWPAAGVSEWGLTSALPAAAAAPALPAGWVSAMDPASGSAYFFHQASGATQWAVPT
jgi:hypothetical protein